MSFQPFLPFDTEKAVQAAAALIRRSGGSSLSRIRLAKLLYLANRKMLKEHGRTIFNTRFVAMKNGPLSSDVQNLIQGVGADEEKWSQHIAPDGRYSLVLIHDPGNSRLSQAEVDAINDTVDEFAGYDDWAIVEITHQLQEWQEAYPDPTENTSRPIPLPLILHALGMDDAVEEIQADIEQRANFDRLFSQ